MDITSGVFFFCEEIVYHHPTESSIINLIKTILRDHGSELGNISVIFCSDNYLLKMNKEYLDHDYYTDIITFPMHEDPMSGDLFISIDRVKENAHQNNHSFESELNRVIVHGVLHLVGYGDKSEPEIIEMRTKEDYYLKRL